LEDTVPFVIRHDLPTHVTTLGSPAEAASLSIGIKNAIDRAAQPLDQLIA
jgi:hypothetical protein